MAVLRFDTPFGQPLRKCLTDVAGRGAGMNGTRTCAHTVVAGHGGPSFGPVQGEQTPIALAGGGASGMVYARLAPQLPESFEGRSMEHVKYEVDEPTATITLNRPETLNAWTETMGREVKQCLVQAEDDARVVVIILTGQGRGFCSGADLGALSALSQGGTFGTGAGTGDGREPGDADMGPDFRGPYTYLMSVRKPIIAAINGPCAGMALPIALGCDIRFAADTAVFTSAFARRGLIAEWGISWMLPRLVGTAHAMDILLSARKVPAAEAERMGLVNKVLPQDQLMPFTYEYAQDLATYCSPTSMKVIKRQIYQHWTKPIGQAESESIDLMLQSFQRPDFGEGVQSFLERRNPKFPRVGKNRA